MQEHAGHQCKASAMHEPGESGESEKPVGAASAEARPGLPRRVFISYASHDSGIAQRVCSALETAGYPCWMAPRNVIPGTLYADGIVEAIDESTILVLILSAQAIASAHVGREVERAASKRHPIIAFRTDTAPLTPGFEYFLNQSQWIETGSGGGAAITQLVGAVGQHLASGISEPTRAPQAPAAVRIRAMPRQIWVSVAVLVVLVLVAAYFIASRVRDHGAAGLTSSGRSSAAIAAKSIAVLPFTDMSEKKDQEYFADGLSEELINALALIEELQVAARTSSFSFKGQALDVEAIGRKLHVGAVLEGSVRRSGKTVRVTVQLINASNGFHLWSHSYDRDLKDVLAVQSDIAIAVAQQLQVKLLGNEAGKIEVGGTRDPQAYDAYLRATQLFSKADSVELFRIALAAFDQAIALDAEFAAAHGGRAFSLLGIANGTLDLGLREDMQKKAGEAAERAVALAPDSGEAHLAAAVVCQRTLQFSCAASEFDRALVLAPGSAQVQRYFARFASILGHREVAQTAARRAVRLDPQNYYSRRTLAGTFYDARLFNEAIAAAHEGEALNPELRSSETVIFLSYLGLGRSDLARQICESPATVIADDGRHWCLALAYYALRMPAEAQSELLKLRALGWGEARAVSYAGTYAQRGDTRAALDWLATAERTHAAALEGLKVNWLLDPIRNEPEFKALEQRLKFPP
jgi:TolB-like protein